MNHVLGDIRIEIGAGMILYVMFHYKDSINPILAEFINLGIDAGYNRREKVARILIQSVIDGAIRSGSDQRFRPSMNLTI